MTAQMTASRYTLLVGVVIAKILLAALMPLTGDEAYFVLWGQHPALGYYDHPPLAGWWLALILPLSDHVLAVRFAAIAVSLVPAILVFQALRASPEAQWPATLVALFSPLFFINIFYTTDTWLICFGILAMWSYVRATQDESALFYLLCGLCLGLAFFSKYLAVLIGLGMVVEQIVSGRRFVRNLLLILLAVFPFVALNLWWNVTHCGYNLMFNLVNRQSDASWDLTGPLTYALMLLYVLTPWLVLGVLRQRPSIASIDRSADVWRWLWIIPGLVLLLVSLIKPIGLHWVIPIMFAFLMAIRWSSWSLRSIRWAMFATVSFGIIHYAILMGVAVFPVERWIQPDRADRVGFYRYGDEIGIDLNARYDASWIIASPSYSRAATMSYHTKRDVPVFGQGSRYGRQSDLLFDLTRAPESKVAIVGSTAAELESFEKFFSQAELYNLTSGGNVSYWVLEGEGLRADVYATTVIAEIVESFYQIPSWMPVKECEYTNRAR